MFVGAHLNPFYLCIACHICYIYKSPDGYDFPSTCFPPNSRERPPGRFEVKSPIVRWCMFSANSRHDDTAKTYKKSLRTERRGILL